jgi:hypothetical protein
MGGQAMMKCHITSRLIITTLIVAFTLPTFMGGLPTASDAMLLPSDPVVSEGQPTGQRLEDLQTIQKALESKLVGQRLADLGFTAEEITAKLNAVSDQQLHTAATQIESVLVGGNGDYGYWPLSLILLVAAIVVLVLLL